MCRSPHGQKLIRVSYQQQLPGMPLHDAVWVCGLREQAHRPYLAKD